MWTQIPWACISFSIFCFGQQCPSDVNIAAHAPCRNWHHKRQLTSTTIHSISMAWTMEVKRHWDRRKRAQHVYGHEVSPAKKLLKEYVIMDDFVEHSQTNWVQSSHPWHRKTPKQNRSDTTIYLNMSHIAGTVETLHILVLAMSCECMFFLVLQWVRLGLKSLTNTTVDRCLVLSKNNCVATSLLYLAFPMRWTDTHGAAHMYVPAVEWSCIGIGFRGRKSKPKAMKRYAKGLNWSNTSPGR